MYEAQRDQAILQAVAERHFISVQTLTENLGTSEATVRRDLRRLADAGRIRRVRGGAEVIERPALVGQPQFGAGRSRNTRSKQAIARRAAAMCRAGDSIIIDGGTTTYAMGDYLGNLGLHILTNSFPLAQKLATNTNNRVLLPGGEIFREQQVVVSPYEQPTIQHFSGSMIFMSSQAVGLHGLMQSDPLLIQAELQLIERAERVVAMIDSSKFQLRESMVLCPLQKVDVLITEQVPEPKHRRMLVDNDVELVIAEVLS